MGLVLSHICAAHPHSPTVQFTQLGVVKRVWREPSLADSERGLGNRPHQCCKTGKKGWKAQNIHSFTYKHPLRSALSSYWSPSLCTLSLSSSPCWVERMGRSKPPASSPQNSKTSGTWHSRGFLLLWDPHAKIFRLFFKRYLTLEHL